MWINIKPNKNGTGTNKLALTSFNLNKTSVSRNEPFTVTVKIRGVGFFDGGQAGAALADSSGNIVTVVGTINYNALNAGLTRTSTINCFAPTSVNAGQYRLMTVIKPEGESWKTITLSAVRNNVPNARNITVTAALQMAAVVD
jgi:hypothetical protein